MGKFIAAITLVLLIAAAAGTSPPTRAANGDLDRSFAGYGTGGRVIGDPFPGTVINDALALPDDKLIVVGSNGQDFVVARYDASGKLDPSFGNNGVTTLDFDNHADFATAVALSFDGAKILVAGTTSFGTRALPNSDFAVAQLNADGTPDTSFSQDGKTTVDFNGRADQATAVRGWYPGNKILVAGSAEQNPPGIPCAPDCNQDFGFALLTSDGSLDLSFGNGGKAQNDFGGNDTPLAVDFASPSGFIAVGSRSNGTSSEYVFALYISNGMLSLFRTGSSPSRLTDMIRLPDNTLVASGEAGGDFGLLAFKDDLSPISDFGTNGMATVDFGANDTPHALYQLSDGTFFVAGESGTRLAVAHVTAKGQLVPNSAVTTDFADTGAESVRALAVALVPDVRLWTIGTITAGGSPRLAMMRHFLDGTADDGGRQTTDFGADPGQRIHNSDRAQAAVFQPDGKLLVAGSTQPYSGQGSAALVRYTAAGALDPSFDGDGRLTLTTIPNGAIDIAVQPDDKIVVAGGAFNVARLKSDGSPDTSFNGTGYTQISIDGGVSMGMALQSDGKIVLAGYSNGAPNTFILARFTATGTPDTSFGLEGIVRTAIGFQAVATDVALQPDGKLVAAGYTGVSQTDANFALVRYNADGSLDASFDSDGKLTTDFGSIDVVYSLAIQPDGAIVAGGVSSFNGPAFARYRVDGSLDPSFDGDGKQTLEIAGRDTVSALTVSAAGITAVIRDPEEKAGMVVRLTPGGKLDTSINGNGLLPFHFAGINVASGIASAPGRIAVVGRTHNTPPPDPRSDYLSDDFAVAMYESVAGPTPSPTPSPSPSPGDQRVYLPLVRR
jgi:uncharacterized delta-60 repeat protein